MWLSMGRSYYSAKVNGNAKIRSDCCAATCGSSRDLFAPSEICTGLDGTFALTSSSEGENEMSRTRVFFALAGLALATGAAGQTGLSPQKRIEVSIDASKTAAPISPYMYGQFIEHIGDLINRSL